ncbi:MAG: hypothetical protein A3I00_06850 [Betaproteobacteria bacterium RIFCSPLOWO2_02_FULL_64_12]|nr:MAG: hypothetical protein A3I00_06850 [Betaproteobacteria bacterium RIFCSPLOWO2_02_FULL_64_12]
MPVDDSVQRPHMWQSKKNPFAARSTGAIRRSTRLAPIFATPGRNSGAMDWNSLSRCSNARACLTDQTLTCFIAISCYAKVASAWRGKPARTSPRAGAISREK